MGLVHSDATGLIERLGAAAADSDYDACDDALALWLYEHPSICGALVNYDPALWLIRNGGWATSLDAALALAERILPDHDWSVGCLPVVDDCDSEEHHHFGALLYSNSRNASWEDGMAHGATPALALCIAILKATTASAVGMERASAECTKPGSPDEPRKAEESNGGGE